MLQFTKLLLPSKLPQAPPLPLAALRFNSNLPLSFLLFLKIAMSIYQVANNVRVEKQCHCLSFQLPRNAILHTFVAVVVVVVVVELACVKFLHLNNSSKLCTSSCFFPSTFPQVPPPSQVPLIFFPNPLLLLFLEILHLLFAFPLCSASDDQNPLTNHRVVHNAGANISQQTVSALKHFQCQQCTTGQNNSTNHRFYMQSWSDPFPFFFQTSNFQSSFKYYTMSLVSDINHELNAKLVRLNLQTSHFNSQSGQNNSANQ